MKKERIAIGADHAGFLTKSRLVPWLAQKGYSISDMGTDSEKSCDYHEVASLVAASVARGKSDRGILLCGTGNGMAIAANKVRGIRAALAWSPEIGALASEHNWANMLCLPSRFVSYADIKKTIFSWLKTRPDRDIRHQRRVGQIAILEKARRKA